MSMEGGTDGDVFRSSVEHVLAPQLGAGQVVIMDNLKVPKVAGIREAMEATRAREEYLPSYSPELSPIELSWSKLKAGLPARAARTREALEEAWTEVLPLVPARDARQWFAHCGYRTAPN